MLLKAAINGGRFAAEHPAIPLTNEEVASATAAAVAAGADVVHSHVRTADGGQSIHPDDVAAWARACRKAAPGVQIGTTTGLWTVESHEQRMEYVATWPEDAMPDFASSAFCEPGAAEIAQLIVDRGMVLESAVWSMADVPALLASPTLHQNVRILIEPEDEDPTVAVAVCREVAAALRDAGVTAPILYHGYDETVWPVVQAAIEDGCETRIGFEDGLTMPDGSQAPNNETLVQAVRALEREITSAVRS